MRFRKKDVAQVEMTAFAAGAGPPANRIATRRKLLECCGGVERELDIVPVYKRTEIFNYYFTGSKDLKGYPTADETCHLRHPRPFYETCVDPAFHKVRVTQHLPVERCGRADTFDVQLFQCS